MKRRGTPPAHAESFQGRLVKSLAFDGIDIHIQDLQLLAKFLDDRWQVLFDNLTAKGTNMRMK